jgi:hypothetical protein
MTLAKHYSRKAVIEAAKQAGRKWRELSYAEITAQALAYCEANREAMIAKALRAIQAIWPLLSSFGINKAGSTAAQPGSAGWYLLCARRCELVQ